MFSDVKRGRVTQRCSRMLCRDAEFYQGGKRKATGRKTKEDKKKRIRSQEKNEETKSEEKNV